MKIHVQNILSVLEFDTIILITNKSFENVLLIFPFYVTKVFLKYQF